MERRSLLKAIGAVLFGGASKAADIQRPHAECMTTGTSSDILPSSMSVGTLQSLGSGPDVVMSGTIQDPRAKDWKLYRVLYDYGGWKDIEGDAAGDEAFQRRIKDIESDDEIGWLIGRPVEWDGNTHIVEVLEGKKEDLEYVLGLMRAENARFGVSCEFTGTIDDAVYHGTCLNGLDVEGLYEDKKGGRGA